MSFDFGAELSGGTSTFKNPEVGAHAARLASIIHVGQYQEKFQKELKDPCNQVIAIFELKEEDDFQDDDKTIPMTIAKPFPLKRGDRAFVTKFINALDPKGTAKGFDDLIGRACTVDLKGSKETKEDGEPKYVNFAGMAAMTPKMEKYTEELTGGVGHVTYPELTKEALMELSSFHVQDYIIGDGTNPNSGKNLSYKGSKAEELIQEIRKDNPTFGMRKAKGDDSETKPAETVAAPADMNEDDEF